MMSKQFFIFPLVAGAVMAFAGINIVDKPIKTMFLLFILCMTHEFTKGKSE